MLGHPYALGAKALLEGKRPESRKSHGISDVEEIPPIPLLSAYLLTLEKNQNRDRKGMRHPHIPSHPRISSPQKNRERERKRARARLRERKPLCEGA